MTKQREIEILNSTIHLLGPHSYLGPWLTESRSQIVADIANDFGISAPMPGAARSEGLAILEQAKADAAEIVAKAREQAAGIVEKAYDDAARVKDSARAQLERAASQIR